ncbi:uncharacterized protein MICPUCDRAFT_46953 [Micromonas pusilla CCMP1545]|uniref:Predicted protein n=1 Tax=Micromonas pusilla (strain CCMP1545) TaxID=564608 RepID=C1MPS3_MICPC|nr:uncharacterized protein MICPUCDRAFT_46953 [Micromonas pusilla CCMP1545]EEH57585.1 predicted protein [Micromonas pusilla CCMP1545]|eukprot:XP_003057634.1 predicted protein [Micromonas pusilla CCMP1545]
MAPATAAVEIDPRLLRQLEDEYESLKNDRTGPPVDFAKWIRGRLKEAKHAGLIRVARAAPISHALQAADATRASGMAPSSRPPGYDPDKYVRVGGKISRAKTASRSLGGGGDARPGRAGKASSRARTEKTIAAATDAKLVPSYVPLIFKPGPAPKKTKAEAFMERNAPSPAPPPPPPPAPPADAALPNATHHHVLAPAEAARARGVAASMEMHGGTRVSPVVESIDDDALFAGPGASSSSGAALPWFMNRPSAYVAGGSLKQREQPVVRGDGRVDADVVQDALRKSCDVPPPPERTGERGVSRETSAGVGEAARRIARATALAREDFGRAARLVDDDPVTLAEKQRALDRALKKQKILTEKNKARSFSHWSPSDRRVLAARKKAAAAARDVEILRTSGESAMRKSREGRGAGAGATPPAKPTRVDSPSTLREAAAKFLSDVVLDGPSGLRKISAFGHTPVKPKGPTFLERMARREQEVAAKRAAQAARRAMRDEARGRKKPEWNDSCADVGVWAPPPAAAARPKSAASATAHHKRARPRPSKLRQPRLNKPKLNKDGRIKALDPPRWKTPPSKEKKPPRGGRDRPISARHVGITPTSAFEETINDATLRMLDAEVTRLSKRFGANDGDGAAAATTYRPPAKTKAPPPPRAKSASSAANARPIDGGDPKDEIAAMRRQLDEIVAHLRLQRIADDDGGGGGGGPTSSRAPGGARRDGSGASTRASAAFSDAGGRFARDVDASTTSFGSSLDVTRALEALRRAEASEVEMRARWGLFSPTHPAPAAGDGDDELASLRYDAEAGARALESEFATAAERAAELVSRSLAEAAVETIDAAADEDFVARVWEARNQYVKWQAMSDNAAAGGVTGPGGEIEVVSPEFTPVDVNEEVAERLLNGLVRDVARELDGACEDATGRVLAAEFGAGAREDEDTVAGALLMDDAYEEAVARAY